MSRYLVTGATGGLGSQIVEFLLKSVPAHEIVALAREPEKLSALVEKGVEVRAGDYLDKGSLEHAFSGVDKLLLVSAPAFTDATAQHKNVIEAAKQAGVRHLHYIALQRPNGSTVEIPGVTKWEEETEALLEASGLDVTILRNTMYFDMLPFGNNLLDAGIRVPADSGLGAFASRRDLAEGAAVVLSGSGHEGKTYTLSGGVAVSMADIAAAISKSTGREIGYQNIPVVEFIETRMQEGFPEPVATFLAAWFRAIAAGEFAEVTGDLERLIGRKPQSAEGFFSAVYRA